MKLFKSFISRSLLVFTITMVAMFCTLQIWEKKNVIDWDVTQYYSYLPATFMYHDYTFADPDSLWQEAHFKYTVAEGDTLPVKMTAGLAYLYSPFFLSAHGYALNSSYPADGFSTPYKIGILFSALVFAILGFYFLSKFIAHFFSERIAVLTSLVVFLGTNLTYYTFVEPMSHVYSFALISIFLFSCVRYFSSQSLFYTLVIGLSLGVLVLIRPVNFLVVLFPIVLLLSGYFKFRLQKTTALHFLIIIGLCVLVTIPQLLYWRQVTGNWLYYSYGEEGFFFLDPEIWKGLFSYRKGLFIYSPVLILSVFGFFQLFRSHKKLAVASAILLVAAIWVIFSWWCWWYGGGFGARALIDYLPFMAIPLAAFLHWVSKKNILIKGFTFAIVAYCCFTSLFMSMQYFHGIIHHDGMSKELFWKQYLVNHYIADYAEYLDPPNYEAALKNEDE